jgi:RimJ/RimL family protein N-acetyltransferase
VIRGEKVVLRPVERADLPRFVRWFADPDVRRYLLIYLPLSLAQEERWFEGMLNSVERQESVLMAIETLDGVHIGNIGLHRIDWKNRSTELGIVIGEKSFWNQGLGTDAIRTLLGLAFGEMNLHRVYLHVDADNARGIRCYERAGFTHEGVLRDAVFREGVYHDQHVMSVLEKDG